MAGEGEWNVYVEWGIDLIILMYILNSNFEDLFFRRKQLLEKLGMEFEEKKKLFKINS